MIEPIMYFGIGFLVAALLGLLFVPLVHNRAVRLTMRRLEAATPLSIAEIRADKDQLRAEFAMSTRRLEMSVEQMKTRTTSQLAELGKKTDAINQLKKELGEKTTAIASLEAREKHLRDQLGATEDEFALKSSALREAERALADKEAELAKLVAELGERSILADSQRVELASVRTQIETMKLSVADYERAVRTTEDRLTRERGDAEAAANQLNEARGKLDELAAHTAELERQLVAQTTEAELLGRRVQELETRLGEQGRLLAEREFEIGQLRSELATASKIGLRDEIEQCRRRRRCGPVPRRHQPTRSAARRRARGARQAAARDRHHEARGGNDLGRRAGRERAVARAHQRRRRRSRAAHRRAGRPRLADRVDARRRGAGLGPRPSTAGGTTPAPRSMPRNKAKARSPTASAPCSPAPRAWRRIKRPKSTAIHSEASLDTRAAPLLISRPRSGRALSSAGERSLHTGEVVGSIPTAPTSLRSLRSFGRQSPQRRRQFLRAGFA